MSPASGRAGLSFVALLTLGVNGIVGVGIFFASRDVAERAPGHTGTWIFLGTAALLAPIGLAFATLARRIPEDGGPIAFARAAFGDTIAYAVGWAAFVSAVASTAAIVSGLVEASLSGARGLLVGVEVVILVVLSSIAALGLATSSRVWTAITAAKLVPLLVLLAAALLYAGEADPAPRPPPTSARDLFAAALAVVFTFQGFEIVPVVAGRASSARADVPRAILGSLTLAALLYAGLHEAAVRALPSLASSRAPLVDAAGQIGGPSLAALMRLGTTVSALGIAFGMVTMTPRYLAALRLPFFSRETARAVPLAALVTTAALVTGLFALGSRRELFALSSVTVLTQYGMTSAALFVLAVRRRVGLGARHAALGALAGLVSLGLAATGASLREAGITLGLLLLGFVLRRVTARRGSRDVTPPGAA